MVLTFSVGGVGVVEAEHRVEVFREDNEHAVQGHIDGTSRSAVSGAFVILLFSLSFYVYLRKSKNDIVNL